jgi:esterase/lipase
MANSPKSLLYASAAINNFLQNSPTQASFIEAQQLFSTYKNTYDKAALEILPNNKIEENVLLYVHSFTQGPEEIKSVKDIFIENNFNILALSYSGHELNADGSRKQNYRDYSENDWKNDVHFAFNLAKQYGKKVWLMGYSTGGLLALQQLRDDSTHVKALILIAPALALGPTMSGLACTGSFLINSLDISSEENQKITAGGCLIRNTITNVFETIPAPIALPKEIETVSVIKSIQVPIFLAYTERDTTVDNWRAKLINDNSSAPVDEYVFGSEDHATHGDILQEYVVNLEMKKHPGNTLKSALGAFIKK